jgi:cytosine/adenosine deaminase-related metal-dependent hydrolase
MFQPALYFNNITLLTAAGPVGHSIRVKRDRIVAIDGVPGKRDLVLNGRGGFIIPGFINAHDHLELNTFKRLKYRDLYSHSLQWIEDIEARFETDPDLIEPRHQPLEDRLLVSALKNLLSGVTTVCHHNPLHHPLRRNYPIRIVKNYGFCHSLFRGDDPAASYKNTKPDYPWLLHLAEGTDERARAEFDQLDRLGLLNKNTILIHGVGLTPEQQRCLIERGGGLIWCPGSNNFLFGQTASVQALAGAGKLALGSDSRLSGEFDFLSELRVAQAAGQLPPQALFQAATTQAAQLLRLRAGGQGRLEVGGPADLLLLPPLEAGDKFAQIFKLRRSQLELVMLAGKPLVSAPWLRPLFEATRTKFESVWVDQSARLMPYKLVARLKKSSVLEPGFSLNP